jgi:hypothetical protein
VKIGSMYESEFGQSKASLDEGGTNSLKCLGKIYSGLADSRPLEPIPARVPKIDIVSRRTGDGLEYFNLKKLPVGIGGHPRHSQLIDPTQNTASAV